MEEVAEEGLYISDGDLIKIDSAEIENIVAREENTPEEGTVAQDNEKRSPIEDGSLEETGQSYLEHEL